MNADIIGILTEIFNVFFNIGASGIVGAIIDLFFGLLLAG